MQASAITVLILTRDEEANLGRTLAALAWAQRIVIVDSGSRDGTREIARSVPAVTWLERTFDSHSQQWNFGLDHVTTEWTLALDADYVCPASLAGELAALSPDCAAYEAAFSFWIHGRPLRGSLYPARVVLFRTRAFRYEQDGHTQRLATGTAAVGRLRAVIAHDDRKPLGRWLDAQRRYVSLEADLLRATPVSRLGWKDRVRLTIVIPAIVVPLYCLIGRGLLFDGWRGWYYALQRAYAEILLAIELTDRRLSGR